MHRGAWPPVPPCTWAPMTMCSVARACSELWIHQNGCLVSPRWTRWLRPRSATSRRIVSWNARVLPCRRMAERTPQ
eukprot:7811758-Pyramimonas_sp.AAC.1